MCVEFKSHTLCEVRKEKQIDFLTSRKGNSLPIYQYVSQIKGVHRIFENRIDLTDPTETNYMQFSAVCAILKLFFMRFSLV